MSAVWSSFKRTTNNPRRFDKPWQLMTGYGRNIAKTKQDGSWVKYVYSLMPEKQNNQAVLSLYYDLSRLVLQNRSSKYWRTIRNIVRAFWETLFESERAKESPEIYLRPKRFRTIFEKRAPVYSLAAPLLGMAKSIYYCYIYSAIYVL